MTRIIVLFCVLSALLWTSIGLAQTPAVRLQDEGATQGFVDTLNCTGAGLTCSKAGGIGIINGSGGAGGYATIQDEATPLTQRTTVNFTGAGVSCVDNGGSTRTDCTITSGGGAPTTVPYWTGAADATLSAEHNLGALGTGLVLNTAGTPSILAGNTCAANNFGITISASGALACAQPLFSNLSGSATDAQIPNNITIDLATLASTATALAADPADCLANNFASSINASGTLGCSQPVLSTDTTGNYLASSTSGAGMTGATTASHGGTITPAFDYTATLGANPTMNAGESRFSTTGIIMEGATANLLETLITVTDPTVDRTFTIPDADSNPVIPDAGAANNFLTAISTGGVISKAQPSFSNISGSATDAQVPNTITIDNLTQVTTRAISDTTGTLAISRGGTGQTTITTNQLYVGNGLDSLAAKTLPSCSNATTSKLLYDNATQTFSCGTDQTGGGGSANFVAVTVDFTTGKTVAKTVVTGQAWVTSSSVIACTPTMMATADRIDGSEDAVLEEISVSAYARVVGTGFTVAAHPSLGRAFKKYLVHCTGA